MYFWATGALSSFLDNAPTYLVFFNTAGGDPQVLMTALAPTLVAISAGAVFMGANTYIGNAPNLMVKAIAEDRGVKMPSFFGYMLCAMSKPRILVARAIFPDIVDRLRQHFDVEDNPDDVIWTPQELAARLADKDGVLTTGSQ
eukprot:gene19338-27390_t